MWRWEAGGVVSGWAEGHSCRCVMEPEPRGSRKEKEIGNLRALCQGLKMTLGGLFVFSEGEHAELEEEKQRETAVQSPTVTRDTISETGRQASEGGQSPLPTLQSQAGKAEEAPNGTGDTGIGLYRSSLHVADPNGGSE